MASVRNPYYAGTRPVSGGYVDQGIGSLFQDVVNFVQLSQAGSRNDANEAAARLNNAKAIAEMDKVNALRTPPETLAKLFLSGGKLDADTAQLKPGWEKQVDAATAPRDYSLAAPVQDSGAISSIFTGSGVSPNEQMGKAFQEAIARGIKVDDIAKVFAQGGYLNQVNNGTPDEGMGYLPLFGQTPNKNTALSVKRQNELQAIDTNRAFGVAGINRASALDVARQNGQNQRDLAEFKHPYEIEKEELRQKGRIQLATHNFELKENKVTATKPSAIPNVSPQTIKSIRDSVTARAGDVKYMDGDKETNIELDENAKDAIVVEVTRRIQDPALDGAGYKNPALALDSVMEDLLSGQLGNLKYKNTGAPWYTFGMGTPTTQVTRKRPDVTETPAPTVKPPQSGSTRQMRSDPASVDNARRAIEAGADRNAVIKRLRDAGIDPTGL